jgi:hypothetical protein
MHGARAGDLRALDDRSRLDEQHLAFEQTVGDDGMRTCKDSRKRLPRDPHALCRRILVESLAIGESNRFELVEADDGGLDAARWAADRPKSATVEMATDPSRYKWPRHGNLVSICSYLSPVKGESTASSPELIGSVADRAGLSVTKTSAGASLSQSADRGIRSTTP